MREGTANFQNGDLHNMARYPVADAIRIGHTKPYECSYPVFSEKPKAKFHHVDNKLKDGK